ncbi:MAG: tetratricopeptide repeat protein [Anaerolineae bacterium]|jgi:tetratricopeptide (TPR) repeat protein
MILIPPEFMPAYLLTYEQVSERSKKLLDQSRRALSDRQWAEAERHATAVRDATRRLAERSVDHAIALIHLADLYRTVGRLGPALQHNEDAQQALKNMPGSTHYHNRAVSDYALGLTHHALGSGDQALHWYQHAKELFDRTIPYWGRQGDQDYQIQNEQVVEWINALIQSIVNQEEGLTDNPFFNLTWFPVFPKDVDGKRTYRLARFLVSNRQVDSRIVCINNQPYEMKSADGSRRYSPMLDFEKPYVVVEIDKENQGGIEDSQAGDMALLQMESIESGLEGKDFTGEFVRDDEGNVRLIGTRKRIIGDLIAILRPTEMQ